MKRKAVLAASTTTVCAVGVALIVYLSVNKSRTSVRVRDDPALQKASEASEKKTSAAVRPSPGQAEQTLAHKLPTPAEVIPDTRLATDKFSGKWVLDMVRSEGLDPTMNQVMTVRQSGNTMEVETTVSTAQRSEWKVNDTYKLNGLETEFTEQSSVVAHVKGTREVSANRARSL